MSDGAPHRPRWPRLLQLWFAWTLASVLGGMLSALVLVLSFFAVSSGLAIFAGSFAGAATLVAGFFGGPAIGAVPQALLLRRSAEGQRSGRALAWIATSTLGGLLQVGFLFVEIGTRFIGTNFPPLWADVLRSYVPVTAVVSLLVAGAQTAALYQMVPMPRLLAYLPLTLVGWIAGWTIFFMAPSGAFEGGSLGARIGIYLWSVMPFALIGAFSGVVLAPHLSTRNHERLAGAYPWIVSAVAATLVLMVVIAALVLFTEH